MGSETLGDMIRRLGRLSGLHSDLAQTDAQLLDRFARRHEESAFAALVARHGPMVLGVCRRLLHDSQEAEDAFQAAFLILARKAGGVRRQALLGGWLHGVAYRVAARLRGRAARRRERLQSGVDLDSLPADAVVCRDVEAIVQEEVGRLPDVYRSAIVLCHLEGKTNEEAAVLLRRPVGTVKSRLTRARELLRTRLTRRGLALSGGALTAALAVRPAPAPAALLDATIHAAARFAAGEAAAGGLASARAVALTQGMLRTMMLTKLKIAAALVLGLLILGGTGGLACRGGAVQPPDAPKAAAADKPAPAGKAAPDDKSNGDKDAIQGAWRVTEVETEGKKVDKKDATKYTDGRWVFTADKLTMGAPFRQAGYELDATKTPKTLDIDPAVSARDANNEGIIPAIYLLDGDVLKICLGPLPSQIKQRDQDLGRKPKPPDLAALLAPLESRRPKELATKEGGYSTLLMLKREPADKEKPKEEMKEERPKDDRAALQGRWRVVSVEVGGKETMESGADEAWTVKDGWIVAHAKGQSLFQDAVFAVHPNKNPKEIDINPFPVGPFVESDVDKGIYTLDGDVWKVCLPHALLAPEDAGRPKEMTTKEGSKAVLVTLKRAADKPEDGKDAIQGTWEVIGIERGGRQLLDTPLYKEFFPSKWVFTGDRLVLQATKEFPETAFTYTLDPSKTPKQMDKKKVSQGGAPAGQEEVIPSIYSLEGDTLKICTSAGKDRPTELAAPRVNQNELVTLRRVTAAAPADEKPADSGERPTDAGNHGTKLLQEWRDASNEAFRLHREEFDRGKVTPEVVIAAEQRLLDAELAGVATKAERVAAYQAHLGRVKEVMKAANMKSDAGKIAPADVADVEAYQIKAEVLLEREKAK